MKKHNLYRGFTIIEVVLVLAIAGLIFLMVFLALPALQRSQRNEQRKRDMVEIAGAIQNYRSDNKGKMPISPHDIGPYIKPYIRHDMRDPDGDEYIIPTIATLRDNDYKDKLFHALKNWEGKTQVWVYLYARCAEEEGYVYGNIKKGNGAITIRLESGDRGNTDGGHYYCLDI